MRQRIANTTTVPKPKFSVIIPTYQRLECLRDCLTGISANLAAKSDFEVIVVDDHSDDDPSVVINSFKPEFNVNLLYQEKNQGPAAARNRGAGHARGDYLLFIDDDCIPCPEWLDTIGEHLNGSDSLAIGGNCLNELNKRVFSEAQQMMMDYLYAYYNSDPTNAQFCPTNNLAIPRKGFLQMGGFDTSFRKAAGEDRDFSARWLRTGADMRFITDAPVYHQHAMGLKEFFRMHYWYGRGARRFHHLEAEKVDKKGLEPIGFYTGLIFFPFSQTTLMRAATISLLQLLSQVAHTFGYLREMPLTR